MSKNNQGIPEVPSDMPNHHRSFLTAIRNTVNELKGGSRPPGAVTNFTVTPVAGGNVIQFTRPIDADNTMLYSSNSNDLSQATLLGTLGYSTTHTDNLGQGGITKHYWVRTYRGPVQGVITAPLAGTSLALGSATSLPRTPPASDQVVLDATTNKVGPSQLSVGKTGVI